MNTESANIPATHNEPKTHGNLIQHSVIQCCNQTTTGISLDACESILTNTKELWSVGIKTHENCEELETHELSISMLNGKMWRGNINDLAAVFATLANVENYLKLVWETKDGEKELLTEVTNIFSHLSPVK